MIRQPDRPTTTLDRSREWDANSDRRSEVLRCVRHLGGATCLSELSTELASRGEYLEDAGPGGVAAERQVRTRLHHVDLPKLDDLGMLDYDSVSKVVFAADGDDVAVRSLG